MPNEKQNSITLQQKIKVLNKLFEAGYTTEKKLQQLDMQSVLKIKGITISDITVITELQMNTKSNKLFSYFGGGSDEQTVKD